MEEMTLSGLNMESIEYDEILTIAANLTLSQINGNNHNLINPGLNSNEYEKSEWYELHLNIKSQKKEIVTFA